MQPDAIACPACGFQGRTPPDVAEALRAAAGWAFRSELATRQLTGAQVGALNATSSLGIVATAGVVLSLLFPVLVFIMGVSIALEPARIGQAEWSMLLVCTAPLVVSTVAAVLMTRSLLRRGRTLEDAMSAAAPIAPGQPFRCRVCGAPLESRGSQAVARCRHCRSDNVVASKIVARAAGQHIAATSGFAQNLQLELRKAAQAQKDAGLSWLLLTLFSPILASVLVVFGIVPLLYVNLEADPTTTFVVADFERASGCLGEVVPLRNGKTEIRFGDWYTERERPKRATLSSKRGDAGERGDASSNERPSAGDGGATETERDAATRLVNFRRDAGEPTDLGDAGHGDASHGDAIAKRQAGDDGPAEPVTGDPDKPIVGKSGTAAPFEIGSARDAEVRSIRGMKTVKLRALKGRRATTVTGRVVRIHRVVLKPVFGLYAKVETLKPAAVPSGKYDASELQLTELCLSDERP